jgi:hypothetical protein
VRNLVPAILRPPARSLKVMSLCPAATAVIVLPADSTCWTSVDPDAGTLTVKGPATSAPVLGLSVTMVMPPVVGFKYDQ